MKYRTFAKNEHLSAIGLGCMSMSHAYGSPDDPESIRTLHLALDLGVNFWDTADVYGNGRNEVLISQVLPQNRDKIFIATKFGFRTDTNAKLTGFDARPAYMRQAVEASLRRLKIDTIDLYYAHRIDPNVPVEEMVGAMAELITEGKVRYLGLSEASANSIRRAHAVHPISALQSEYSLLTRDVEREILPLCDELGITFVPFSPLARGLMTNTLKLDQLADNDFRRAYRATSRSTRIIIKNWLPVLQRSPGKKAARLRNWPWHGSWLRAITSSQYLVQRNRTSCVTMPEVLMFILLSRTFRRYMPYWQNTLMWATAIAKRIRSLLIKAELPEYRIMNTEYRTPKGLHYFII